MFLIVLGTRPQVIKFAPLCWELKKRNIPFCAVNTGQHYDHEMCDAFYEDFNIPSPEYNLQVGGGSQNQQIALSLLRLEPIIDSVQPRCCIVFGDTSSTLAAALAANKKNIPIAHIEGGLRSYNNDMPEETNRILVDRLAKWNFCPTKLALENLSTEGLSQTSHFVGDIMYDLAKSELSNSKISEENLDLFKVSAKNFCLLTFHRAENLASPKKIKNVFNALNKISQKSKVLWPAHPGSLNKIKNHGIEIPESISLLKPLPYFQLATLQKFAKVIFTDSGGIQKEAFFHGTPCITLREETEWVETVKHGWNIIAGTSEEKILAAYKNAKPGFFFDEYGTGNTSSEIIDILCN
jgi:UDP-GlcNAc3NAcA epimerase